jgi:hypothetical protein
MPFVQFQLSARALLGSAKGRKVAQKSKDIAAQRAGNAPLLERYRVGGATSKGPGRRHLLLFRRGLGSTASSAAYKNPRAAAFVMIENRRATWSAIPSIVSNAPLCGSIRSLSIG